MKSEPLSYSLIGGGVVALAWALSSTRISFGVDAILGYLVVAAITAMVVSEYRWSAKTLTSK